MTRLRTPPEPPLYYRADQEGDAPMATVLANDGVRISYRVEGEGPTTLLFMHGWAGSGVYFDEVVAELDLNAVQVVTMDFRGHGDSEKAVKPYDADRIADDVWA